MTFSVRIFGHRGLARIPIAQDGATFGTDSVYVLEQPYLWNQTLTSNGSTAVVSTVASVPANHTTDPTKLLRVEVPDGQSIRYEVTINGDTPAPTSDSPLLTGRDQIAFGPSYRIGFIDAAGT